MPQKYAGNLDAEMISGTVENDLYQKHEMVQKFEPFHQPKGKRHQRTNIDQSVSSIQTGPWSLLFSQPRTLRFTPPAFNRLVNCGLNKK